MRQKSLANSLVSPEEKTDSVGRVPKSPDVLPRSCEMSKIRVGMSVPGPGCVKTCASRECAELFSLFSSFDGGCQSGSFVIQRNRDKLSTRKFDVRVFTQPGSKPEELKV